MAIIEQGNAVPTTTGAKETFFVFGPKIEDRNIVVDIGNEEQGKDDALQQTAQALIKSLLERHALDRSYRFHYWVHSLNTRFGDAESLCSRRAVFSPRGFCPFA